MCGVWTSAYNGGDIERDPRAYTKRARARLRFLMWVFPNRYTVYMERMRKPPATVPSVPRDDGVPRGFYLNTLKRAQRASDTHDDDTMVQREPFEPCWGCGKVF